MPNGNPNRILEVIAEAFDVDIFSEYEPQFWGFDTQEEWDAWHEEESRKAEDEFYLELLLYVADQPNPIEPATIGEQQARIAKQLVSEDPTLVSPERRREFMDKIETIYERDHTVYVKLSDEDLALAEMRAISDDDFSGVSPLQITQRRQRHLPRRLN